MSRLRAVKDLSQPASEDSQHESLERDFARLLKEKDSLERRISELDGRVFELNSLLRAGKGFSKILELRELLKTLSEMLLERFDTQGVAIYLHEDEKKTAVQQRWSHPETTPSPPCPVDRGWFWQMVREGKPFSIKNLNGEARFERAIEMLGVNSYSEGVCVPLRKGADLIGVLFMGMRTDGNPISENEYPFIEEFAALAALNLDSVLKYEKNMQMLRDTRALFEIQEKTVSATNENVIREAFEAVVSKFLKIETAKAREYLQSHENSSASTIEASTVDLELLRMLAERAHEALKRIAFQNAALTDRLTGLSNGRHFDSEWHRLFNEAKTDRTPLTIAVADIDHFKKFNDTHGHAAGDAVLKTVARVFRESLSKIAPGAQVFRYGGEEFTFLLPKMTGEDAVLVLDKIRTELEKTSVDYEDRKMNVTASFGVAEFSARTKPAGSSAAPTPARFFKKADEALYDSKKAGRNCVTLAKS